MKKSIMQNMPYDKRHNGFYGGTNRATEATCFTASVSPSCPQDLSKQPHADAKHELQLFRRAPMQLFRRNAILGAITLTSCLLFGGAGKANAANLPSKPQIISDADGGNCYSPRWSHDGNKISYEVHFPSKDSRETFIVDLKKGNKVTRVLPAGGPSVLSSFSEKAPPPVIELAWHPKGRAYIYSSTGGKTLFDIYMQGEGILTSDSKKFSVGNRHMARWSPDGKYVVYAKEMVGGGDIFLFNIFELEKGETRLSEKQAATTYQPEWSPDGKRIVFTQFAELNSENDLYILDDFEYPRETTRRLTRLKGDELNPSWSPDGKMIGFFSNSGNADGKVFDLYWVNASGGGAKLLIKDVLKPDRGGPVWSADSKKIYYVKRDHDRQDPIMWVDVNAPETTGTIVTGTELNDDLSLFYKDNSPKLAFTAQSETGDNEKTWRKVYIINLPPTQTTQQSSSPSPDSTGK